MDTVTSADGTEIAFERTESGPPLVLVHGGIGDHRFWDLSGVRPALGEHCTVYAMDRRGCGESEFPDSFAKEQEAENVAAVADATPSMSELARASEVGRGRLLGIPT